MSAEDSPSALAASYDEDELRPPRHDDDDGDDSQLSDLDEEIFNDYNSNRAPKDEQIPIDEDTIKELGKFKKKRDENEAPAAPSTKGKKRRSQLQDEAAATPTSSAKGRGTRRGRDDDEEDAPEKPEIEMTEDESASSDLAAVD